MYVYNLYLLDHPLFPSLVKVERHQALPTRVHPGNKSEPLLVLSLHLLICGTTLTVKLSQMLQLGSRPVKMNPKEK